MKGFPRPYIFPPEPARIARLALARLRAMANPAEAAGQVVVINGLVY